jgi:CheY-like chemotaxis protein
LAKVLVVDSDSVFAAVVADRLHVSGHEVRRLSDGLRAAALAQEQQIDLVLLGQSPNSGVAVVEALRGQAGTRSVPILMLSEQSSPADRVAALRAGADDFLSRPCDLDELLLRLDRLLANRTAALQVLQGDLANHPLWALLQYLGQVRKSGVLRVQGESGAGTIDLRDGDPVESRWQGLRGREALLALLSLEQGGFRFDPAPDVPETLSPGLPLQELLMQSAWLKDEIGKRRHLLPPTGQALQALTPNLPAVEASFHQLPLQRVFERVLRQPGVRLFDLIADEAEAPISTRLAVVLLVESGAIAVPSEESSDELQNTREISTAILFEVAVEDLIAAAGDAGFASTTLPYLLLVESAVWPLLRRMIEQAPGFRQHEGLRRLVEQVELRRAGSANFPARAGKVSLHVQVLAGAVQPQVNAIVPGCAGLLVWLRGAEALDSARAVVQRFESSGPSGAVGVLVAGPDAQRPGLLQGTRRWRSSAHEPHSLLGLLRLLHPDAR